MIAPAAERVDHDCEGEMDDICRGQHVNGTCGGCEMRQLRLCASVDAETRRKIHEVSQRIVFAKGRHIVDQGEPLDRVYFIRDGMIVLSKILEDGTRCVTGFLGPGDIISGIKHREGAYCTGTALTDVATCSFRREEFMHLLQENSQFGVIMLMFATDEIEAQHDHNVILTRKHVSERLAAFLLFLVNRWVGPGGVGRTATTLPMSRADIGDYLGVTIESVSRGLTKFREDGFISMPSRDRVVIENLPALYELSGLEEVPVSRGELGL